MKCLHRDPLEVFSNKYLSIKMGYLYYVGYVFCVSYFSINDFLWQSH